MKSKQIRALLHESFATRYWLHFQGINSLLESRFLEGILE
jgi:hypothetical protein